MVASKEEFDMLRITKKGSGAHTWDHLSPPFKELHGVHYIVIESWTKLTSDTKEKKRLMVRAIARSATSDGVGRIWSPKKRLVVRSIARSATESSLVLAVILVSSRWLSTSLSQPTKSMHKAINLWLVILVRSCMHSSTGASLLLLRRLLHRPP